MKKLAVLVVFAAIVSMTVSSCKSHERCPAYGKVTPELQKETRA